jgi:Fe/S biogenesis protein NfuA
MTDSTALNITITEAAQDYLAELLAKQDEGVLGVRMFVNQPGTPKAETCIAYCRRSDSAVPKIYRVFRAPQSAVPR